MIRAPPTTVIVYTFTDVPSKLVCLKVMLGERVMKVWRGVRGKGGTRRSVNERGKWVSPM